MGSEGGGSCRRFRGRTVVLSPLLGLGSARRSAQDLPNSQVRPPDPQPSLQGVASCWPLQPHPRDRWERLSGRSLSPPSTEGTPNPPHSGPPHKSRGSIEEAQGRAGSQESAWECQAWGGVRVGTEVAKGAAPRTRDSCSRLLSAPGPRKWGGWQGQEGVKRQLGIRE